MHVPVLAGPALEWLAVRGEGTYVDCTAGAGGHSELIAQQLTTGRLISLDRDEVAVGLARERLKQFPNACVVHTNYDALAEVLTQLKIEQVDGVLIDAGFSSMQLDDPVRGFSCQDDGPLDMRMDRGRGEPASDYLRHVSSETLEHVLKTYGDIGPAKRIARQILADAANGKLNTTSDLCRSVSEALPFVQGQPDEVRTVFQAIRIAVNDELTSLERALEQAIAALAPNGRVVAIAFHSGEDRVVKHVLQRWSRRQRELTPDGRVRRTIEPLIEVLTPKPVLPDEAECRANSRSRSAKLRAAKKVAIEEQGES